MLLPYLTPSGRSRRQVTQFGGVDYGEQAGEGTLSESRNLSARLFPSLTQRRGREAVPPDWEEGVYTAPSALFLWKGKRLVVDDGKVYYDGNSVGTVSKGEKQFAVVNTKLIIWPDKKYLDLNGTILHDLEAEYSSGSGTTTSATGNMLMFERMHSVQTNTYQLVRLTGEHEYERNDLKTYTWISYSWGSDTSSDGGSYYTEGEKENRIWGEEDVNALAGRYLFFFQPEEGQDSPDDLEISHRVWYGESLADLQLRQDYTPIDNRGYFGKILPGATEETRNLGGGTTLTTITFQVEVFDGRFGGAPLTESGLNVGDVVDVLGGEITSQYGVKIASISDGYPYEFGTITFEDADFGSSTQETDYSVTVRRSVPDLTFICESENRLWGVDAGGSIRASALGDPTNFNDFTDLSTAAYAVAVGTDGDFTGIASYSGSVLAFKERVVHKVIGSYPAEYAVYTYDIPGIQAGCHKSAAVLGEVLYYKARDGVYAYTGGTPYRVSQAMGERRFQKAVAGVWERSYYLSMQEEGAQEDAGWGLWVFDTGSGLWMREDESHILDFAEADGVLYGLTPAGVYRSPGGGETIPWTAEFTPFYEDTQSRKRHDRLLLRLELDAPAWAQASVRRDGGNWETVWRGSGEKGRSFLIPLMPRRCDRFQVKLEGEGGFVLRSMTWEYKTGSQR